MNKASYSLVLIVGILTCFQSFAHAIIGYPAVLEHIEKGEILPAAAQGMQIIWVYSSIMMLLSGIWLLLLAKPIRNGEKSARLQALFLGIGLLGFGLFTIYISGKLIHHLSFFTVEGLILLVASTLLFRNANVVTQSDA